MAAPVVVEQDPSSLQGCMSLPSTHQSSTGQSTCYSDAHVSRTGSSTLQSSLPAPVRAHQGGVRQDQQVSRASSASVWTSTASRAASLDTVLSSPVPGVDSLSADGSADGPDDPQDYVEEEELYRSLAENLLAVVPFGVSLERYLAGIIYRYGRGEWSIEDARQVCAYVTGPHRLAPLLWRTARMAPRAPARGITQPAAATSTFAVHASQQASPASTAADRPCEALWRPIRSHGSACHGSAPSSEGGVVCAGQRWPTRDDELIHSRTAVASDLGSHEGPFSLTGVHITRPSRPGQRRSPTNGESTGRHAARTVSPAHSNSGLMFWDEQNAQQMYMRYQAPEVGTDRGTCSDMSTARGFPLTPTSHGHNINDVHRECALENRTRVDLGALLQPFKPFRGANVDQASLPSMGGILHSIPLEDGCGVVSVEEGAAGGTLGVGSSARQSHDCVIALSEYGQVDARAFPGRCSRDTNQASRPGTGSCDENNPCLAHVHAMQALHASRASTSSLDGVRIAPADAAPYNAAQSLQYHSLSGEAARAERWQQRSAPACSPNAVTMHRCSRNRAGSAYTDTATEGEIRPIPSSAAEGSVADGRSCDIFRGMHGSGAPCGAEVGAVASRRARSAPEMQLEPLDSSVEEESREVWEGQWAAHEDTRQPLQQQANTTGSSSLSSREDSHIRRRLSSMEMADGSDHLTQYYASILDRMNDPRSQALMHRTLDIFNNQPPSPASTAETAELFAGGTRAAAVLRADSGTLWGSASGSGSGSTRIRRCLFAQQPHFAGSHNHSVTGPTAHPSGTSSTHWGNTNDSAAAAAAAMVASHQCIQHPALFAWSTAGAGPVPITGVAGHSVPTEGAGAGGCDTISTSPPCHGPPAPARGGSTSRRSSSHVCLEAVPEAAEVHCGVDAAASATTTVGISALTQSAAPDCRALGAADDPFVDARTAAAAINASAHPDHICAALPRADSQASRTPRQSDDWFSRCCSSDGREWPAPDRSVEATNSEGMSLRSPRHSIEWSPAERLSSDLEEGAGVGSVSECSSSMEGGFQRSGDDSGSCTGDPPHHRGSGSSSEARSFDIGHKLSDSKSICSAASPDGKVSLVLKPKSFDPQAPPNTAASASDSAAPQHMQSKASCSRFNACAAAPAPALQPQRSRRLPHTATRSSTGKPPFSSGAKTQGARRQRSLPLLGDSCSPCRTTSAEDMALLRLEPRRRHRSLRVSADRDSSPSKFPERSKHAGADTTESLEEAPAMENTHCTRLGTLAEVSESYWEMGGDGDASQTSLTVPPLLTSLNQEPVRPPGPCHTGPYLPEPGLDVGASNNTAFPEVTRKHGRDVEGSDEEPRQASVTVEVAEARTRRNGGPSGASVAAGSGAPGGVGATCAAPLHAAPHTRRNSTHSTAGHSFSIAVPAAGPVSPAAPACVRLPRRSFAAATSSAARFNGLMYTSATDADGQITTNRTPAGSLGPSLAGSVRSSAAKVGLLCGHGGANGGNGAHGDHTHGGARQGSVDTAPRPGSLAFRKHRG